MLLSSHKDFDKLIAGERIPKKKKSSYCRRSFGITNHCNLRMQYDKLIMWLKLEENDEGKSKEN